ncbi:MAG TPA: sigma-70 family RNA polymerase sigma factor [Actinomycetota bacterium]|nr:sigma-70 family RNA polymerase sigma factor [Actinomycetota bacterium]
MEGRSDVQLIERLLVRDEVALREVIAAYGGVVHGMARRVLAEPALAEEVAQDTFVALWRRPGAFDPARGSLQSFLLGIVRNKAVDLVRKEESLRRTRDTLAREVQMTEPAYDPSDEVEERQRVRVALESLTEVQREAIVLAYFGGRTYREVAEELEIPEGTAKTRLRDGLVRLRRALTPSPESEGWT